MRIAVFVTEDWYVRSHRLPLLAGAVAQGHEVLVLTRIDRFRDVLESTGATVVDVSLDRASARPTSELRVLAQVAAVLRRFRPDVVHNVGLKPVLYGTLAAKVWRTPVVVNAMAGLGALFVQEDGARRHQVLRAALGATLRSARSWVIVQNPDDDAAIRGLGVREARIVMIRGCGVDTAALEPTPEPPSPPVVVRFFGRLLWDKGLAELHRAAQILEKVNPDIRVELVGAPDRHNPACIDADTIARWEDEGTLALVGHVDDVAPLLRTAHIVVLPSYREGLPKALLEGAAAGRPLIATDVPGCRDVVRDGETGLLVPVKDAKALAGAIDRLSRDRGLRAAMGARGRAMVEAEFCDRDAVEQTIALYERALAR